MIIEGIAMASRHVLLASMNACHKACRKWVSVQGKLILISGQMTKKTIMNTLPLMLTMSLCFHRTLWLLSTQSNKILN